jgi:hypothetical protein
LAHRVVPDGCEARDYGGDNTASQQKGTRPGDAQLFHIGQEIDVELAGHGDWNRE